MAVEALSGQAPSSLMPHTIRLLLHYRHRHQALCTCLQSFELYLLSATRLHYRLLTLCPVPTHPVGQSWPRGTGSVGDSVGEGSDMAVWYQQEHGCRQYGSVRQ